MNRVGSEKLPWDKDLQVEVEFGVYPEEETCVGFDYSPQIRISGMKAPYLAIIMDDPDAEKGGFTHWTIWNIQRTALIPRNVPKRGDVEEPLQALQGRNSYGEIGYAGPCPPEREEHTYVFRVYGLDGPLDLHHSSSREDLEKKMAGHIVQYGQVEVKFRRTEPVAIGREGNIS